MIAGVVAVCIPLRHIHIATVVLVLILAILIISGRWGFLEGSVASALGAVLLDYFFLPPRGLFIDSTEHWLVLFTFLCVALLASYSAARAKRQADEAVARRRELEKLSALAQGLRLEGSLGSIVVASLDSLIRLFQVEGAAFYDVGTGDITRAGSKPGAISEACLRDAAAHPEECGQDSPVKSVTIHCGGQELGILAVCGSNMSGRSFRAIADRIEAELEKVYVYRQLRHAEETRRNQELKTALLDSLVHEIKTPLSVIKTAASSLMSTDSDATSRRELLTIINEETDRMDASISDVFWTARIEAGVLQSGKGPHEIGPLVNETLSELKLLLADRCVIVSVPDLLPPANCDAHMIKGVLKELVNNALKYSPSHSSVMISAKKVEAEIITSVSDQGIGVPPGEEIRIFEKHHRGTTRVPGTGLGLAIAKTIVEGHGGRIGVESQDGVGSVFYFSLPICNRDAA